jgi:hypothetical protein
MLRIMGKTQPKADIVENRVRNEILAVPLIGPIGRTAIKL